MKNEINQFKEFARNPYAWPGGYPLFAICNDGAAICHQCARDNYRIIRESQNGGFSDGWNVVAIDVNWEDSSLYCDHCGELIESAYSE